MRVTYSKSHSSHVEELGLQPRWLCTPSLSCTWSVSAKTPQKMQGAGRRAVRRLMVLSVWMSERVAKKEGVEQKSKVKEENEAISSSLAHLQLITTPFCCVWKTTFRNSPETFGAPCNVPPAERSSPIPSATHLIVRRSVRELLV